jgi:hypothetical protein
MRVLAAFPALRLTKDYVLRAYTWMSGMDGGGIVWAMPVNANFPKPDECVEKSPAGDPKPPEAVDDIMDVIEGDGSLWSYLSASIFFREISEFGAFGHMCNWSTHKIIGNDFWDYFLQHGKFPGRVDEEPGCDILAFESLSESSEPAGEEDDWFIDLSGTPDDSKELGMEFDCADSKDVAFDVSSSTPDGLKWLQPQPSVWEPVANIKNGIVTVTFHTFSGAYVERLTCHVDTYRVGSYCLTFEDQTIAEGSEGYCF